MGLQEVSFRAPGVSYKGSTYIIPRLYRKEALSVLMDLSVLKGEVQLFSVGSNSISPSHLIFVDVVLVI